MANVSQIINLGIGTPSDIPHYLLVGLGPEGVTPPPPSPSTITPGAIQIGQAATILANATEVGEGEAFALPAVGTRLSWQTIFAVIPIEVEIFLLVSQDGIKWSVLDSSSNINGELRTKKVSARFVKADLNAVIDDVDLTVKIMVRKEKMQ